MTEPQSLLNPSAYFVSAVYTIQKPEFLQDVLAVADELLAKAKAERPVHEVYPSIMSSNFTGYERTVAFETFIAESAWIILDSQGYKMDGVSTYNNELWAQEHQKFSGMEQHIHNYGVVISGFYFLNTPEEGCMVELHDPRPGKVQAALPLKDPSKVTDGSSSLFLKPEAGMFIFTNSWLPHSFTRNMASEPVKFVHFNVSVRANAQPAAPIIV